MVNDSGNAAVNWSSFLNQIIQGGIDVARVKHLGIPTADQRVPDQADLYYGDQAPAATMPTWIWPTIAGVVVLVGALALLRMK